MANILIGICLLSFGIIGIAVNWWAVIDFIAVIIPAALLVIGTITILSGLNSQRRQLATPVGKTAIDKKRSPKP